MNAPLIPQANPGAAFRSRRDALLKAADDVLDGGWYINCLLYTSHKVPGLVEIKPLHGLVDKAAGPPVQGERQQPEKHRPPDEPAGPKVRHENPNGGPPKLEDQLGLGLAEDVRQRPLPGREIRLDLRQALIIENPRHHEPHGKRQGKACLLYTSRCV